MLTAEELIAQSKAMLAQTKAEGSKPFFGSAYDELGIMTTDIGAGYKQELDKSVQNMTGQVDTTYQLQPGETTEQYNARIAKYNAEKTPTTPAPPKEAIGDNSITYINPETGQTQTRDTTTMTPDDLQQLINQGFAIQDVGKNTPSWISQNNPEMGRALAKETAAEKEFNDAKAALLASTTATADQGTLNAIAALYDVRKADMERINAQRQGSISTLGIRLGQRWTGSEGGVFGGIITEENRQGVQRITDLEAQKQNAISAANEAARTKKWTQYSKFISLAEDAYKLTQDAIKELNKTTVAENKKVAEIRRSESIDFGIAGLLKIGFSDPKDMLFELKKIGISATSDEINKSMTNLSTSGLKEIGDIIKDAAKNGAPPEIIDAIGITTSLTEAVKAAEGWLQNPGGIVGEYLFYKRQGGITDFDTYQNIDANRKAKIVAAANAAGIDSKTQTVINNVSTQFTNSPIVKQFNEVLNKKLSVDSIIQNGVGGPADLALVFDFMKALDPTSVVRESEYATASKSGNLFLGWAAKFNGYMKEEGGFLPENVKKEFQKIIDIKYNSVEKQYDNSQNEYAKQINLRTGRTDGSDFLIDYKIPISQIVDDLRDKVANWAAGNPANFSAYEKLVQENPDLSDLDIMQILGIPQ